jgi:hypothetical protein
MTDLVNWMTEAIFGHIKTEEEVMMEIKTEMDNLMKDCQRSLIRNQVTMDMNEKRRIVLAKRGKMEDLKRETRSYVLLEKKSRRIERNIARIDLFRSRIEDTKVDQVLSGATLRLMQVKCQSKTLLDASQTANIIRQYQYQSGTQKSLMDMINEEMKEVEEEMDEADEEMDEADEDRMQELMAFQADVANQETFNKLPKPVDSVISQTNLNLPEYVMKRTNNEEKKKLDDFLSGKVY